MKILSLVHNNTAFSINGETAKEKQGTVLRVIPGGKAHSIQQTAIISRQSAIEKARRDERKNLSYELHDNVSQVLFSAILFLNKIEAENEKIAVFKEKAMEYAKMAQELIRTISHGLVKCDFEENGLEQQLKKIISDISLTNQFEVFFECDKKIESLCYTKKTALLRISQEQLKNVIKHSQATSFKTTLKIIGKAAVLTIADNGVGFHTSQDEKGIGLSNIKERVRLCNGEVEIISSPGNGCRLVVKIPVGKK